MDVTGLCAAGLMFAAYCQVGLVSLAEKLPDNWCGAPGPQWVQAYIGLRIKNVCMCPGHAAFCCLAEWLARRVACMDEWFDELLVFSKVRLLGSHMHGVW